MALTPQPVRHKTKSSENNTDRDVLSDVGERAANGCTVHSFSCEI